MLEGACNDNRNAPERVWKRTDRQLPNPYVHVTQRLADSPYLSNSKASPKSHISYCFCYNNKGASDDLQATSGATRKSTAVASSQRLKRG